jgi:hypothetical protein
MTRSRIVAWPLAFATLAAMSLLSSNALAACSSPAGNAGDVFYSSINTVMVYCNGTNWIAMGSSAAVSYGTLTTNDFCVATSGTAISCTTVPTGTGNVVLSSSPTLTGTAAGANSTWTGQVAVGTTTLSGAMNVAGTIAATGATINGTATATTFSGSGASLTSIPVTGLSATGTANSTTFLRGDGAWAVAGNGTVTSSTIGQVAYYAATGSTVIGTTTMYISGGQVGIGTATPVATLTVNGTAAFMLGTDYTTTGSQSDVAINTASTVRYNGAAIATFYGVVAGTSGQIIHLHNASSYTLTLSNQSASEATAANKIITGSGADLAMASNSSVILQYDTTASRWRVIGGSGGTPGGSTTQVQFNNSGSFGGNANLVWDNTNYRLGIGTATPLVGLDLSQKTDAVRLPSGTTGTRPATPVNGDLRYNSTIPALEAYVNSAWVSVGAGGGQLLGTYSTGTAVTNYSVVFTGAAGSAPSLSGSTLTLASNTAYVVVETWGGGGGGAGGTASGSTGTYNGVGGGGGGGGYAQKLITSPSGTYYFTVGSSGAAGAAGVNGSTGGSTCFGTNSTACTSATLAGFGGGGGYHGSDSPAIQGAGGSGGTSSGGDVNLTGSGGAAGASGTSGQAYSVGGAAGSAPRGGGGGNVSQQNGVGTAGAAYGGGGAGGGVTSQGGAGGTGGITISAYSTGSTQAFNIATQATGVLPVANGGTGVTSSTGTGSVVLSASPTLTGTVTGAASNWSGNVGIGTTSPATKLHVTGTGGGGYSTGDALTLQRTDATNPTGRIDFTGSGGSGSTRWSVLTDADVTNDFGVAYNGSKVLQITTAGNVGIGLTAPNGPLEIHAGTNENMNIRSPVLLSGSVLLSAENDAGTANTPLEIRSSVTSFTAGSVGIGITTPGATLHVNGGGFFAPTTAPTTNGGVQIDGVANGRIYIARTNADTVMEFYYVGSGRVGSIGTTSSATSYATSSDRRLKENFADSKLGLNALMDIPVQDFNFISDKEKKRVQGFIAQDVYKVYPEAVTTNGDDGTKPLKDGKGWSVDYGRLTPLLARAIQELKADNDNLRAANDKEAAQIKTLTARIDALEAIRR